MYPIPLSRESLMILGWFLVFFAVAMRSGGPAGELANPMSNAHDVSVQEAIALIDAGALVIDVRERAASANSHLPGALLIPLEVLSAHLSKLEAAKARSIVVYCGNGSTRGPQAVQILTQAGFAHAVNLKPGIEGWRATGLPVAAG
jgi:rhodanese-related sulfurtransferase